MNRKRSRWLAGLLTLMLGISAFPVNPRSAEAAFEGWAVDETQWKYSENGAVITSKGNVIDSIQSAGTVRANKIDFSAAIQRVQSDVDGESGSWSMMLPLRKKSCRILWSSENGMISV